MAAIEREFDRQSQQAATQTLAKPEASGVEQVPERPARAPNVELNGEMQESGFEDHYPAEAVHGILLPEDDPNLTKMPAVVAPGTGEGRGILIRDLNFVLPFGLLVIGLKMLLRTLRVLSGELKVDPDAAHDEEGLTHAHDHDREIAEAQGR